MTDREVVITHLDDLRLFADVTVHPVVSPDNWDVYSNLCDYIDQIKTDVEILLKEQEKKKFFVDSDGKITPLPDVVRCKDCVHRGKVEKCVLAAIAAEKGYPLFMLDNRGEWFCADGRRAVK